jgi:hypothetical protein
MQVLMDSSQCVEDTHCAVYHIDLARGPLYVIGSALAQQNGQISFAFSSVLQIEQERF